MTRILALVWVIAANNRRNKMTKAEMKKDFEAYYAALVEDGKSEGAKFNKAEQWEWFQEQQALQD
jgi:hypothetical protein